MCVCCMHSLGWVASSRACLHYFKNSVNSARHPRRSQPISTTKLHSLRPVAADSRGDCSRSNTTPHPSRQVALYLFYSLPLRSGVTGHHGKALLRGPPPQRLDKKQKQKKKKKKTPKGLSNSLLSVIIKPRYHLVNSAPVLHRNRQPPVQVSPSQTKSTNIMKGVLQDLFLVVHLAGLHPLHTD